ncbi:hypothetical protein YC2023_029838 [Brassica napus]
MNSLIALILDWVPGLLFFKLSTQHSTLSVPPNLFIMSGNRTSLGEGDKVIKRMLAELKWSCTETKVLPYVDLSHG